MWGSSFNDLAKKAAEMQEQAAASITSPTAPTFSMGGMFNMDSLQAQDEKTISMDRDTMKNLANAAMEDAKAVNVTGSSTFYNPMQPIQPANITAQQPAASPLVSKKLKKQSKLKPIPKLRPPSKGPSGPPKTVPSRAVPSKNLFPPTPVKTSPLVTPKEKLTLPVKKATKPAASPVATTNKTLGNLGGTNNKLKINPPTSSLVTKTPAKASNNSVNALKIPKKQEGGLVVNKQSSKQAPTATKPSVPKSTVAVAAAKQTHAKGQAAKTATTTSKLAVPTPVLKQPSAEYKDPFQDLFQFKPTQGKQPRSTSASVSAPTKTAPRTEVSKTATTAAGKPEAKPKLTTKTAPTKEAPKAAAGKPETKPKPKPKLTQTKLLVKQPPPAPASKSATTAPSKDEPKPSATTKPKPKPKKQDQGPVNKKQQSETPQTSANSILSYLSSPVTTDTSASKKVPVAATATAPSSTTNKTPTTAPKTSAVTKKEAKEPTPKQQSQTPQPATTSILSYLSSPIITDAIAPEKLLEALTATVTTQLSTANKTPTTAPNISAVTDKESKETTPKHESETPQTTTTSSILSYPPSPIINDTTAPKKVPEAGTATVTAPSSTTSKTSATAPKVSAVTKKEAKEKLQQQQGKYEKQMEEQRHKMEGKTQQLQQQFSDQLQRLEEHHRQETERTNAQHKKTLTHWQEQVRDREILLESQSQTAESKELISQTKVDELKSKLNQAREYITDKRKEDRALQEAHLQQLREMERQCFKNEDASNDQGQQIKNLEKRLEESRNETQKVLGDLGKLKGRAKEVAMQLKEKRAECRTLSSEIERLNDSKLSLQGRITQLEASGMDMDQSSEETQEKLDSLQSSLDRTKKDLEEAKYAIEQEKKKAEDSLSKYKRKAQQSLSVANARSASAVQSREEAEMEARAARATADTAMERAMKSDLNGRQALAEAKVYVEEMTSEVAKYESVKAQLKETSQELKQLQTEAATHKDANEKLRCELTSASGRLEAEQATVEDMKKNLTDAQNRSNDLYDDVERLRQAARKQQEQIERLTEDNKTTDSSFKSEKDKAAIVRSANAEAEATIAMIQQELQDANRAIKDLKETLLATIEEKESMGQTGGQPLNGLFPMNGGNHDQSESKEIPLFYAMEKQAELCQARDEIARMANLLGDAESSRQEALDEMQTMKQSMEDAQSKLQRQEQLQAKRPGDEKSLNIEYLKNIMMSFLNANTTHEKKALLPVISTVLCLTQAEQTNAIEQLEKGGGSYMESATSVLGLNWS